MFFFLYDHIATTTATFTCLITIKKNSLTSYNVACNWPCECKEGFRRLVVYCPTIRKVVACHLLFRFEIKGTTNKIKRMERKALERIASRRGIRIFIFFSRLFFLCAVESCVLNNNKEMYARFYLRFLCGCDRNLNETGASS